MDGSKEAADLHEAGGELQEQSGPPLLPVRDHDDDDGGSVVAGGGGGGPYILTSNHVIYLRGI